ncbi:MAG: hypothetical protein M1134_00730 [Actinobacteria bacterium]|nr:hypothetical protein [Actinomycetota bacterium]MCL5445042.1 hypothetical protein [Actinomycetota bacterium]
MTTGAGSPESPDNPEARDSGRSLRSRKVAAWVAVLIASVLIPLSVATVWMVNTVTSTRNYVATVAPIAKNPAVTGYVASAATNELFRQFDVQSTIANTLPKPARFIAAPLTNDIHRFTLNQINSLLLSPWFYNLWYQANLRAHRSLVSFLTKGPTARAARLHSITLDVTPVLTEGISKLDAHGVTVFDPVATAIRQSRELHLSLVSNTQVARARILFSLLSDLGWFTPLIASITSVVALILAVDRRKTLLRIAVGAGLVSIVMLASITLARSFFIGSVQSPAAAAAAAVIFDTLLHFLTSGLRYLLAACVLIAVGAYLAGPSRWATSARSSGATAWRATRSSATAMLASAKRERSNSSA